MTRRIVHRPGGGAVFTRKEGNPDASGFVLAHRDIAHGERVRLLLYKSRPGVFDVRIRDEDARRAPAAKDEPTDE